MRGPTRLRLTLHSRRGGSLISARCLVKRGSRSDCFNSSRFSKTEKFKSALLNEKARNHIPSELPLRADSVEKVFFRRREKFFRAADAFGAPRREGPHRFTQKRAATFTSELWTLAATERYENRLSRDFWRRSIFDFCNTIRQKRTSNEIHLMGSRPANHSFGSAARTRASGSPSSRRTIFVPSTSATHL